MANPAKRVKRLRENNAWRRDLNESELKGLLEVTREPLRSILIIAVNTGMRKSEILRLEWERINLRQGYIQLKDQKNGEVGYVPINETIKQTLRQIKAGQAKPPIRDVFPSKKGRKPLGDVKKSFGTALQRTDIANFKFQDKRHTYASQFAMHGTDHMRIRELLRHKTMTMTLPYSHIAEKHKQKAIQVMDQWFKSGVDGEKNP